MPVHSPRHHRVIRVIAGAAAVVLLLAGCATGGEEDPVVASAPPAVSPAPTPTPDAAARPLPEVPVRSADLASVEVETVVEPVGVAIPSIDVTLPVEPVGVEDDGQMEIPPRAEIGGWYRYGASPADDEGTAVIAAHVDSIVSADVGPFARLQEVAVGDPVDVTLADGSTRGFTVTEVRRTPKPSVQWDDVFVRGGGQRLVLITCGGSFDRGARSYSDNVIVTAEPRV
ncbi:class F sortase [Actinotalea sp. Marseille-Q4924]|uniref:class F sortase n=1 Tax=Actinotalea sp. Marseille-Q4924 TaxID=2866571 RepID=UPI001CE467BA|nr:class F sortase [Actinotalea sp. Marseille-Q4924]